MWTDQDEAGRKGVGRMVELLGRERVRVVRESGVKDANDALRDPECSIPDILANATILSEEELATWGNVSSRVV